MKKETLTIDNIKKDLNKYFSHKLRGLLLTLLLIPLANIIILNTILLFYNPVNSFKSVFSIIFCIICFILSSYDLIIIIIGFLQTKNGNFKITSDYVVEKKQKIYGSRISNPKPYRLIFANNGTYNIPYGENYCWSSSFAISDKTLYERTNINDDFYIISIRKQKNIISYNKKHFEFKEKFL